MSEEINAPKIPSEEARGEGDEQAEARERCLCAIESQLAAEKRALLVEKDRRILGLRQELSASKAQIALLQQALAARQGEVQRLSGRIEMVKSLLMLHSRFNPLRWLIPALLLARSAMRQGGGGWRGLRYLGQRSWGILRQQGLAGLLVRLRRRAGHLAARWQFIPEPSPYVAPIDVDHRLCLHEEAVDIIVCVHNALDDVRRCLESVLRCTLPPYRLILVDDGSEESTRAYLAEFAASQGVVLLRHEQAGGYTRAANAGLRCSDAPWVVLLNSDTIVTRHWLDRMIMCASTDAKIGIVGPLSNTASWQSIPEIENAGDWADNPLPAGWGVEDMGRRVAAFSARLYVPMPLLNGFCLLIRRALIEEIGLFDEEAFGAGYGEENDYCLRAGKAGWRLALADDVYVHHAQSRSYSSERRKVLCERAGEMLARKHDPRRIDEAVYYCRDAHVLLGLRARAKAMIERVTCRERGQAAFAGRRLLFFLPVLAAGGGANIVLGEARAMRRMGVDARIANLERCRPAFEQAYAGLDVPVEWIENEEDIVALARRFDAVVATVNHTVQYLQPLADATAPVLGYYIQDYEPHFFASESPEWQVARASYGLIPRLRRFTKTEWNRDELQRQTGLDAQVVGASYESDLFLPRPRRRVVWPDAPLRIGAMVRPASLYRAPALTMRVLGRVARRYGNRVEVIVFGAENDDLAWQPYDFSFTWSNLGVLQPRQLAGVLADLDIFVDFSVYQAMGLTAMEAMACGNAVIVPQRGGAASFAEYEVDALLVDTASEEACFHALCRLIEDDHLRQRLARNAACKMPRFHAEGVALRILQLLFGKAAAGV